MERPKRTERGREEVADVGARRVAELVSLHVDRVEAGGLRMKISDRVSTSLGDGYIVGKDLAESSCWRWTILLDDGRERCFFERELREGANRDMMER